MHHVQFGVGFGTIAVTWNSRAQLNRVDWFDSAANLTQPSALEGQIPASVLDLLQGFKDYFEQGIPLPPLDWSRIEMSAWSDFQHKIYRALAEIPHGETRTYAWVARKAGTTAARAVGQALRRNPLPILIPCHRVVGAQAIGGFMGMSDPDLPELRLKKCLIDLENGYLNPVFSFISPLLSIPSNEEAVAAV